MSAVEEKTGDNAVRSQDHGESNVIDAPHELAKEEILQTYQDPNEVVRQGNVDDLVTEWLNDPAHPRYWPAWKRWFVAICYALLQVFVMITSTSVISAEFPSVTSRGNIPDKFPKTSSQVAALVQSMFIVGNTVGCAFLGPLSDINGRKWVYVCSIVLYAILNIGAALPMNMPMLAIFSFLIGTAGSTAASNVAGTISDLFAETNIQSQAMMLFVLSADSGPSLGSPIGEWIVNNPNMGMNWLFWINVIIGGAFALALCFLPETLPAIVIGGKYGKDVIQALGAKKSASEAIKQIYFVSTMAFKILLIEPIVLSLAILNGFAYGLLFLDLDGITDVYSGIYGWTTQSADLTFLNAVVGASIAFCMMPIQTWLYKWDVSRRGGVRRPEARFLMNLVTVWGFPLGLLWFAFTIKPSISPWSSIVAGGVFNTADPILWLSMLSYISDSYPSITGSAIAAFLIPSFGLAAGFVHVGLVMFDRMSPRWAYATLGFCSLSFPVITYIIYFFGPWLRKHSHYAYSTDKKLDDSTESQESETS